MPLLACGCWEGAWWSVQPPPVCDMHRNHPVVTAVVLDRLGTTITMPTITMPPNVREPVLFTNSNGISFGMSGVPKLPSIDPTTCTHHGRLIGTISAGGHPVTVCQCGKRWASLPVDLYVDGGHDATSIIADALREGRDEEALAIYVETHWSKVLSLLAKTTESPLVGLLSAVQGLLDAETAEEGADTLIQLERAWKRCQKGTAEMKFPASLYTPKLEAHGTRPLTPMYADRSGMMVTSSGSSGWSPLDVYAHNNVMDDDD